MQITLALIQMSCSENVQENLNKALFKIKEAAQKGAHIVCLSELFKSLYFCQTNDDKFFNLAEPIPCPTTEKLSQCAKENNVVIVASLYEITPEKDYYNTAVIFDVDGVLLGKYRKTHIPDDLANHYSELYYFKPGNLGYPIFHTKYGTIGTLVCWDQWYPEAARALANQGAQIIFYPTAIGWPRQEREQDIGKNEFDAWQTIQRSHAIANGVFVASCNRTGKEENLEFWGGSFICDPMGVILKQAPHHQEQILIGKIDLERVTQVRKDWPFLDYRRKDLYHQL